jgi:hypothetical protein
VTTREGLLGVLSQIEFGSVGPYTSAHLPISKDIQVRGTVSLTSSDVPVPATCQSRDDCQHAVVFDHGVGIAGVVFAARDADAGWAPGYPGVTLTDTTIRLRPLLEDYHPWRYNFIPVVSVMPPCTSPCSASARKCPWDGVCYGEQQYCRLCEALSNEVCACRTLGGTTIADGGACSFMVSGDVRCQGHCVAGRCQSDNPGWAGCP